MELLIGLAYFLLLTFLITKWQFFKLEGIHKAFIPSVFALKVLFGLLLTAIYSIYYEDRNTADIFKYFDDSIIIYNAAFTNFIDFFQMMTGIGNDTAYFDKNYYQHMNHWLRPFGNNYYNDTHILIRFNALMRFISLGYFSIHTIIFNFLSLLGLVAFFKAFKNAHGINKKVLLYGICLLPSILLWGSGVLKEGILILGMGFFFYLLSLLQKNPESILKWILVLLSVYLLIRLKFYILIALIPGLIAFYFIKANNFKKVFWWHSVSLITFLGIGLNLGQLFPDYNLLDIISNKQEEFICLAEYMNSGSIIQLPQLDGSPISFLKALPFGLFNSMFRPLPWESNSLLMYFNVLEVLFINALLVLSVFFVKPKIYLHINLLFFSISVVIVLFTIIGITTPVVGALVRYKVPALLFIILIISILLDTKKLGIFANIFKEHHENI